jgi:hypothetical protein
MYRPQDYDDDRILRDYIGRNRYYFMTPFERRAESLGMMREKARHAIRDSNRGSTSWPQEQLAKYETEVDDEVRKAIGDDPSTLIAFQQQVMDRIDAAFRSGEISPNRCPACRRIVVSPEARQCLWCGVRARLALPIGPFAPRAFASMLTRCKRPEALCR